MVAYVEAAEVDEFSSAVSGVEIEYVRTDSGNGPSTMTIAGPARAALSTGAMGFSALAGTEIPDDTNVFALVTSTPPGAMFCGVPLVAGQLFHYGPGTTFAAVEPAGLAATMLTVPEHELDAHRRPGAAPRPTSVSPLEPSPDADALRSLLLDATSVPRTADGARWAECAIDAAAAASSLAPSAPPVDGPSRLDSRRIVADAIAFVESSGRFDPTIGELCRATIVSESRLRQAFVDVVDVPPTRYFQLRLLNRLRTELLGADASRATVTDVTARLGITQLGRVAGRYRSVFGEVPSATLRRGHRRTSLYRTA